MCKKSKEGIKTFKKVAVKTKFEKNEKFKLILKRITRTKEEIIRVKNTVGQKFNNLWVNKFNFSTLSASPTLYFFLRVST